MTTSARERCSATLATPTRLAHRANRSSRRPARNVLLLDDLAPSRAPHTALYGAGDARSLLAQAIGKAGRRPCRAACGALREGRNATDVAMGAAEPGTGEA